MNKQLQTILSEEEQLRIQVELFKLLEEKTKKYTSGESSFHSGGTWTGIDGFSFILYRCRIAGHGLQGTNRLGEAFGCGFGRYGRKRNHIYQG